jgi:hypothetical protein
MTKQQTDERAIARTGERTGAKNDGVATTREVRQSCALIPISVSRVH